MHAVPICVCYEVSSIRSVMNVESCDLCVAGDCKCALKLLNPSAEACDLTSNTALRVVELSNSVDTVEAEDADLLENGTISSYLTDVLPLDGPPAGEYVCDPEDVAAGDVRNVLSELLEGN